MAILLIKNKTQHVGSGSLLLGHQGVVKGFATLVPSVPVPFVHFSFGEVEARGQRLDLLVRPVALLFKLNLQDALLSFVHSRHEPFTTREQAVARRRQHLVVHAVDPLEAESTEVCVHICFISIVGSAA